MRLILSSLAILLAASLAKSQTYFYINQIAVVPENPTTSDDISIQLIGDLSSTGAYVVSASAQVTGSLVAISIAAADNGGLTVLVPHTETIPLGQLPAGDYSIAFTLNSSGILDLAEQDDYFFTVQGGDPCDQLLIASVRWHAFSDTAIVVHAQNNNTIGEIFDYPNFILFDANGDTLAKETVNFFGIGLDSWHLLRIPEGAVIPASPFTGRLELWTGFTSTLSCSWDMPFDLCPPAPCATFMPSMGNYGGALVLGTFNWEVSDANGTVANGQFLMTETVQYESDTLCLPPGDYQLLVTPTAPPTGGAAMFFATDESGHGTELWPVEWSLPVALPVRFYGPCIDGSNDVPEAPAGRFAVRSLAQGLLLESTDGRALGPVRVFDAQGRLIHAASGIGDRLFVPVSSPGLLIVTAGDAVVKVPFGRD